MNIQDKQEVINLIRDTIDKEKYSTKDEIVCPSIISNIIVDSQGDGSRIFNIECTIKLKTILSDKAAAKWKLNRFLDSLRISEDTFNQGDLSRLLIGRNLHVVLRPYDIDLSDRVSTRTFRIVDYRE